MSKRDAIAYIKDLCIANNLPKVREAFESNPDLTITDFGNETPIHHLCMSSQKNIEPLLKFLVETKGFPIDTHHGLLKTPLVTTIRVDRHINHFNTLIEFGAKLDLKIAGEGNLIYWATLHNRPIHLAKLIKLGVPLEECDSKGKSHAAIIAAEKNHWDALEVILKHDPSILKAGKEAESNPLYTSIFHGHTDLAMKIIKYKEKAPWYKSIFSDPKPPIMDLTKYKFLDICLLISCRSNQIELIKILIEAGADPYLKSTYMQSPYAIAKNKQYSVIVDIIEETAPRVDEPKEALDKYEGFAEIRHAELAGVEESKGDG